MHSWHTNVVSIFIQTADTWLHISTSSVNVIRTIPQDNSLYQYSRIIDHCSNNPGFGSLCNRNFWGCGIECWENPLEWTAANTTDIYDFSSGDSRKHSTLKFTDANGQYAVLGPATTNGTMDWQAESFAVSTQCEPIPPKCEISYLGFDKLNTSASFNCSKERTGIDMAGIIPNSLVNMRYSDSHLYLEEPPPFFITDTRTIEQVDLLLDLLYKRAPNVTDDQANEVFRNPWNFVTMTILPRQNSYKDPSVWHLKKVSGNILMLRCKATSKII